MPVFSLPGAMLLGGIFAVVCDDLARVPLPAEIPLGIVTSFLGASCFLGLMLIRAHVRCDEHGAIRFEGVGFAYGQRRVLGGGSRIEVSEGSVTAILGPNGVGKTTLLFLALGWLRPSEGQVLLGGRPRALVFAAPDGP